MSDLAPFVAAALRDRTLNDLIEENDKLKQELQSQVNENKNEKEKLFVQITGPKHSPIHYETSLIHGHTNKNVDVSDGTSIGKNGWYVDFVRQNNPLIVPFNLMMGLEIWFGDARSHVLIKDMIVRNLTFNPSDNSFYYKLSPPTNQTERYNEEDTHPIKFVGGIIGPIFNNNNNNNEHLRIGNGINGTTMTGLVERFHRDGTVARRFSLCGLLINKTSIPGGLSLLKRLGIETDRDPFAPRDPQEFDEFDEYPEDY